MIELHEVGLVEGLPPDVAKEPWVQILDAVFRERRKKELEAAERLKIYTDIDRADEAVLDILAVQFRVDWYDTSYPIETKRRIIKTALEVRRYCGTEWAVQKALASIYPNVKISEWYDYGGRPGYWRMNVDITDDGVIYYTPEEIEKRLGYARRCTAHLEHIIYIVEPHERSPAYIAAAPSGMATSCTVKVPVGSSRGKSAQRRMLPVRSEDRKCRLPWRCPEPSTRKTSPRRHTPPAGLRTRTKP